MRSLALLLFVGGVGVLGACGDDGTHRQVDLDTTLDSQPPALTNDPNAVFHFHSTPAGDDFVCQLDGAEPVQCHDPFTMTVADGAHTFSVATLGAQAALDTTPAMATWTVDTVPPETTITAQPAALDNSVAPVFEFTGIDATARTRPVDLPVTFECAVDGGAFAACTSPDTLAVGDGAHTFAVRAKDAATNLDATPAMFAWTVDTSTPDTAIDSGPDNATTTGATAAFAFSSPNTPDATFECALDAAAFAACTSPVTATGLAGGAHTFAVRAKDMHAVVDPSPAMRAWTVDATPPDVTITTKPTDPSNDTTPAFGFTSTDATATFECEIQGTSTYAACTSLFESPALTAGAHAFDVRATDPYGNSAVATYAWAIDLTAPVVAITTGPATGSSTNVNKPSFAFTVTGGGPASPRCALDTGAAADCASPYLPGTLADGAHTVTVTATDAAGNTGSASRTFTVDTMPPVVTFTAAPTSPTSDNTATWAFTTDTPGATTTCKLDTAAAVACTAAFTSGALGDGMHTLIVAATDAVGNTGSAMSTITVDTTKPLVTFTGGPQNPTPTNVKTPTFTFTISDGTSTCAVDGGTAVACTGTFTTGSLGDGGHTIVVAATDTAGNTGTATRPFTIDTAKPVVAFTGGPVDPTPTNDKTPTFTFTIDATATTTCTIDGGAPASCPTAALAGSFTTGSLLDGTHTLVVTATDAATNAGTAMRMFTIDTVNPVVTFQTGPIDPTATSNKTPTFTFTTTEGALTCAVDGGTAVACASGSFTTATLGEGQHHITVTATDAASNTGSATRTFTIDVTPPTVAFTGGPADPTPTNNKTPTFTFTATNGALAPQKCSIDGAAGVDCTGTFTTGSLGDGMHTIVVTATDAAGNPGTATRAFTIDTAAPSVMFTSGPIDPSAPTNSLTPTFGFSVSGGPATTTCAIDGGTAATCTSPYTTPALGASAHTIVVTATDTAGNAASTAPRAFTIDRTAPSVAFTGGPQDPTPTTATKPSFTLTTSGGPLASVVCSIDGGPTTDCASGVYTSALVLGEGSHTALAVATDLAGNPGQTTRTFTVDTTGPSITFDDVPPAQWPVNYYAPQWHASEAVAGYTCSADGGASFAACTSGDTFTFAYGNDRFIVKATDAAGNPGSASTSWHSAVDVVWHFPFEKGALDNSSLLAQRSDYTTSGTGAPKIVGGWAGAALQSPAAGVYNNTQQALSSSPDHGYTATVWIRPAAGAQGVIWSNLNATAGGTRVQIEGPTVTVTLSDGTMTKAATGTVVLGQWNSIALRTTGNGIEIYINGRGGALVTANGANGFDKNQDKAITVGALKAVDVDELRFYNFAFDVGSLCTRAARGWFDVNANCHAGAPVIELAFEKTLTDTGTWDMTEEQVPTNFSYDALSPLGTGMTIIKGETFTLSGFVKNIIPARDHTLTFWYKVPRPTVIWDTTVVSPASGLVNGLRVTADDKVLKFDDFHNAPADTPTVTGSLPTPGGLHDAAIAEVVDATQTKSITLIVDDLTRTVPIAKSYYVFANNNDTVTLPSTAGSWVDEIQFWQNDLFEGDKETTCENVDDGGFAEIDGSCDLPN